GAIDEAWQQIKRAVSSGGLWAAAGLLFLVHVSPGFQTALYFHMSNHLKFDTVFIGWTDSIGGIAGIVASLVYVFMCRVMSLRWSYTIAILAAALGALPFLGLHANRPSTLLIC